jgi:hypothetical protein
MNPMMMGGMGGMGGYVSTLAFPSPKSPPQGLRRSSTALRLTDQGMMGGGLGSGAYGVSPALLIPWLAQLMPRTPWYT